MTVRATITALRNAHARRAATVHRGRLGAWIDAEIAVRAGLPLQHHLEQRYAVYSAQRPTVIGEPWSIVVHQGTVSRSDGRLDPREAVLADPAGVDASFEDAAEATRVRATRATLDAQRTYFARELANRQERLDRVEARRQQLDDDEVALRGVLDGDLHSGRAIPAKAVRRSAVERGRPVLRGAFGRGVLRCVLAAGLFGESLQVYPVMADAMGVKPDLIEALRETPFTALLALVAAVVVVCALFAVFEGAMMLVGRALAPGRSLVRIVNLLGATGALGAFFGGAWAVAALRERVLAVAAQEQAAVASASFEVPVWVTFAFTVVVSMGAAWVYSKIEEITARRESAREAQRAWDEAQSQRVEVRERAEERLAQTLALRGENERAMAAERRAVEALELEARAAEAALAESVAQDRARMMTWLASAEAALLLDRTMFWFAATRRGREDLLPVAAELTVDSGLRRIVRAGPVVVSSGVR